MSAENTNKGAQKIVGAFETIDFPEFGETNVVSKIDTGAYTGALHCNKITERQTSDGKVLAFQPFESNTEVIKDEFVIKYVRSSNGARSKRYFITTKIILQGKKYPLSISLTDRSDMKWQVLIGRRFLRQHKFLVDPRANNS
jgi:hypothetical protein